MLTSIALILLIGLCMGSLFTKLKLPALLGMIITGIIIGPYVLNLLDESILAISSQIRQIALVIILTRAGLTLNIEDLKKVGRPAILMCFVPACMEMIGVMILGPILFDISLLDAMIAGSVVAAVSPAVVVPRMIKLIEEGYGEKHSIPQLILAGASVDDVFVIVVFYAFTAFASTGDTSVMQFVQIPISILLGILLGGVSGVIMTKLFQKVSMQDTVKVIVLLSVSFLLLEIETQLKGMISISALIAIMCMGIVLKQKDSDLAKVLSQKYNKLWVGAEIFLFVLVGACVNVKYALTFGIGAIVLIIGALCFRMMGVGIALFKTNLTKKEKLFTAIAYTPKATVQAAIGSIPLSMGLACGEFVLTLAVLSILITAPFGAIGIDKTYKKLI